MSNNQEENIKNFLTFLENENIIGKNGYYNSKGINGSLSHLQIYPLENKGLKKILFFFLTT